jgi:hypothetical protein
MRTTLALSLSLFAVTLVACGGGFGTHPKRGSTEPGARPKASAQLEAKYSAAVDKLLSAGVFYKVDLDPKHPVVWVTPLFRTLNIDDKSAACSYVAALAFHVAEGDRLQDNETLYLRDSKTGKNIGFFGVGGLNLD